MAAPCETEGRGTTAAVVCLILLLLLAGVLAFLLWRYILVCIKGSKQSSNVDSDTHKAWQTRVRALTRQLEGVLKAWDGLSGGV